MKPSKSLHLAQFVFISHIWTHQNSFTLNAKNSFIFRTYLPLKGFDKHGRFAVLMRPGTIDPNQVKMEESFKVLITNQN